MKLYDEREAELGEELMRALERYLLLQIIDQRWREHLYDMDYLREGIHLRGFAQIEPIVAYKNEAFTLFQDLMNTDLVRLRAHDLQRRGRGRGRERRPRSSRAGGQRRGNASLAYSGGTLEDQPSAYGGGRRGVEARSPPALVQQRRVDENEQIGRNDPCWCGSGKKFKKCHGAGA